MTAAGEASTLVVSYRPATDRVRDELTTPSYRRYLREARGGPVTVGDEWSEFVSRGCGSAEDVLLRVERVADGSTLGSTTDLEFVPGDGT